MKEKFHLVTVARSHLIVKLVKSYLVPVHTLNGDEALRVRKGPCQVTDDKL